MVGCVPQQQAPAPQAKVSKKTTSYEHVPPPPKKDIELKEVEDENFSSDYMYPETKKKSVQKTNTETAVTTDSTVSTVMTKEECISMIGQEKFDKYAQMLGGDAGALKKCSMLKAL